MKYEITIRQLEEFTPEEQKMASASSKKDFNYFPEIRYSGKNFHEIRVLYAEISKEEFEAVKKAIIGVL